MQGRPIELREVERELCERREKVDATEKDEVRGHQRADGPKKALVELVTKKLEQEAAQAQERPAKP